MVIGKILNLENMKLIVGQIGIMNMLRGNYLITKQEEGINK